MRLQNLLGRARARSSMLMFASSLTLHSVCRSFVLEVSLASNNLKAIPKQLFERLRQLESLNVANNTIAFMPDLEGTCRLNRLDVGNNRGFQLVSEEECLLLLCFYTARLCKSQTASFATAAAGRLNVLLMPSNVRTRFLLNCVSMFFSRNIRPQLVQSFPSALLQLHALRELDLHREAASRGRQSFAVRQPRRACGDACARPAAAPTLAG